MLKAGFVLVGNVPSADGTSAMVKAGSLLVLNRTGDIVAQWTPAMAKIDGEVYIRVLLTRGIGDLSYDLKATPNPSIVIIVKPLGDSPDSIYDDGVRVVGG